MTTSGEVQVPAGPELDDPAVGGDPAPAPVGDQDDLVADAQRSRLFRRQERRSRGPLPYSSPWYVPATALTVLAVLLLGFCAQLVVVGDITYARAQTLALAKFRADLARATAPVGQTFTPPAEIVAPPAAGEEPPPPPPPQQPLLYPLGTPVAVMSIPAIGLQDTVVLEGTTPGVTQDGPGHERNSVLPGQEGWSLVFGRAWSYGAPFGRLVELSRGDRITVTTGQGKHTYVVTGRRRSGDDIPTREAGQGRLVLATAEGQPYVPESVLYVDALLTSKVQPTPARRVLDLLPSEKLLAGDSTAWFAILLWVQGLALAVVGVTWLRHRLNGRQAWIVAVPLLAATGIGAADTIVRLLPNVL